MARSNLKVVEGGVTTEFRPEPKAGGPSLSLVICTLNEGEAIGPMLAEVQRTLEGLSYEIIVVDDDSSDGTGDRVREIGAADPRVKLVVRKGVRGLASAAVRGWDESRGEFLALMDGDGQHEPDMPRRLLEALQAEEADLAVGSRYLGDQRAAGLSGYRASISRIATWFTGLILRAQLTDPMAGCFVMRRSWYAAARPQLSAIGFKILVDLVASSPKRVKVAERPTALRERLGGESKLDLRVMVDLAALLFEKWTGGRIPARFVMFAGVGASGIVVNVLLTWLAMKLGIPGGFNAAQAVAIVASMAWNFQLNNMLTFRDQRLHGWSLLRGFLGFCLACSGGAVVNWLAAAGLYHVGVDWKIDTLVGAVVAGVFNFWAVRFTTWLPKKG